MFTPQEILKFNHFQYLYLRIINYMNYEATGKIISISPTQEINDKFRKRDFAIEVQEDNTQYTNMIGMQFTQQKCELLNNFREGDTVRVNFNLRGNKWEKGGKVAYITNLDAWKIEKVGSQGSNQNYGGNQGGGYNPNQSSQGYNQNQGGNNQSRNLSDAGYNNDRPQQQQNTNQNNGYNNNQAPKNDLPF